MTVDEWEKYFVPMLINIYGKDTYANAQTFERETGSNLWSKGFLPLEPPKPPLTDQERNLLTALAGPHWETVLKIYKIQKEAVGENL